MFSLLKPRYFTVIFIYFFMISSIYSEQPYGTEEIRIPGIILLRDGTKIETKGIVIKEKNSTPIKLIGLLEGESFSVSYEDLKKIELLDKIEYLKDKGQRGRLRIITKKNISFELANAYLGYYQYSSCNVCNSDIMLSSSIEYYIYDPINEEIVKKYKSYIDIRNIIFYETFLKKCQKCYKYFPEDYIYCPYCGVELPEVYSGTNN